MGFLFTSDNQSVHTPWTPRSVTMLSELSQSKPPDDFQYHIPCDIYNFSKMLFPQHQIADSEFLSHFFYFKNSIQLPNLAWLPSSISFTNHYQQSRLCCVSSTHTSLQQLALSWFAGNLLYISFSDITIPSWSLHLPLFHIAISKVYNILQQLMWHQLHLSMVWLNLFAMFTSLQTAGSAGALCVKNMTKNFSVISKLFWASLAPG